MSRLHHICSAALACGCLLLSPGCTPSNESQADIKGVPPAGGGPQSQAEYGASMKGGMGGTQGYPGSGGR